VGAGPAGLLAALELAEANRGHSCVVLDAGPSLADRMARPRSTGRPGEWLTGFGGSGLFIGGRLSFDQSTPTGCPTTLAADECVSVAEVVSCRLTGLGAPEWREESPPSALDSAAKRAAEVGLEWQLNYPARHLSQEDRMKVLQGIEERLRSAGISISSDTRVVGIAQTRDGWQVSIESGQRRMTLDPAALLLAPGRAQAAWLAAIVSGLGLTPRRDLSVGVRLEAPTKTLRPLTVLTPDPRLSFENATGHFRTYAFTVGARITVGGDDLGERVTVQPAPDHPSGNTSFSLLWRPRSAGVFLMFPPSVGRGNLADLMDPTAPSSMPGDAAATAVVPSLDVPDRPIRADWPEEYWQGLRTFLNRLSRLTPGLVQSGPMVYSPAIESAWLHDIDSQGRTRLPGLYLAGDGAGVSQGAMAAAVSGVMAARGISADLA